MHGPLQIESILGTCVRILKKLVPYFIQAGSIPVLKTRGFFEVKSVLYNGH